MNHVNLFIFLFLWLFTLGQTAARNCNDISRSTAYFSATATAETEESARMLAQDYLMNQISTTVHTVSELTTTEISGVVTQDYISSGSAVSSLRLKGLKHMVCSESRGSEQVTVMVYISSEDIEKSTRAVESQVREYFELMAQKELMGAATLVDVYVAYLYTFLSPLPISLEHNGRTISDAKTYLEVMISEHMNNLQFDLNNITASDGGMEEQYSVPARLIDADPGLTYSLQIPSINAKATFLGSRGTLHLFIRPSAPTETLNGYLTLSSGRIPPEVQEIAALQTFSRVMTIGLDFSQVITVDFTVDAQRDYIVATPMLAHVSPRTFSWEMGNHRLSNDQILRISRERITAPIRLVINGNSDLSATKTIEGVKVEAPESAMPSSDGALVASRAQANYFKDLQDFSQVQRVLARLRRGGIAVWGKQSDFVNPNSCWVLLVDPKTERLRHVLSPHNKGRSDILTGAAFQDIDEQFKGLIAIWVDFI